MPRYDEKSLQRRKPVRIRNVDIGNGLTLAPMAGVTDRTFRMLCRRQGADYVVSEMISAKAIAYGDRKTPELARLGEDEHPAALQIFGSDPSIMAEAAAWLCANYAPDVIDINMGCPMPKIVNNGDGCALMKDLKKAESVIRAVVSATELPVSVKFRSGYDTVTAVETAKIIEQSGADAICIHPRTREMYYSGKADWNIIRAVKSAVSVPVFGNGDVFGPEDAKNMYEQTGVDGIAVGRGTLGNPFIFEQIKSYIQSGSYLEFDEKTRLTVALEQVRDMCLIKGEKVAIPEARKHLAYYLKGMRGAAKIKNAVFSAKTFNEVERLLTDFMNER